MNAKSSKQKKPARKTISAVPRGSKATPSRARNLKPHRAVEAEAVSDSASEKLATATNFNNVLTASRMTAMLQCPRKHFWSYEIGLRKQEDSIALRIGSAWARAMEARWNGKSYDEALADAVPEGCGFDEYTMATISALLAAYYDVYGQAETFGSLHPEVQFKSDLSEGWTAEGKIDGLGSLKDGRSAIIESKTTSDSVAPDSGYWQRLSFNSQVLQYVKEARVLGWDIACVYYDVTRKPMIQPKQVNDLDEQGLKIVEDVAGVRQFRKDGVTPIQSGDAEKGWTIKSHIETAEEFCDRLYKDVLSRPDFYFCRKEVPVIEQELESFRRQRLAIAGMIKSLRESESWMRIAGASDKTKVHPSCRDPEAWPRNVSENTCDFCQFKTFCLQNLSVDLNNPPQGFTVAGFNPELADAKHV